MAKRKEMETEIPVRINEDHLDKFWKIDSRGQIITYRDDDETVLGRPYVLHYKATFKSISKTVVSSCYIVGFDSLSYKIVLRCSTFNRTSTDPEFNEILSKVYDKPSKWAGNLLFEETFNFVFIIYTIKYISLGNEINFFFRKEVNINFFFHGKRN